MYIKRIPGVQFSFYYKMFYDEIPWKIEKSDKEKGKNMGKDGCVL